MKRQALLIANPGESGASNYCEGVNRDCDSYPLFLKAPFGGAWYGNEIEILRRPSAAEVRLALQKVKSADYGLVIFAGHGYYLQSRKTTMLELRKGEELDSMDLRAGAGKQTLILDCCRQIALETARKAVFAEAIQKRADIRFDECRRYYDAQIAKCPSGLAVLWACSVGETAGDDKARGGYYSFSLLDEAETWAKDNKVDISRNISILNVVGAHDFASAQVGRLSGGRQRPNIEKPRSDPYFPFGIVA